MKKLVSIALTISLLIMLPGCGVEKTDIDLSDASSFSDSDTSSYEKEADSSALTSRQSESSDVSRFQAYSQEIDDALKPEVTKVEIKAKCTGDIKQSVYFGDLYNRNVLHSGCCLTRKTQKIDTQNTKKSTLRKKEPSFFTGLLVYLFKIIFCTFLYTLCSISGGKSPLKSSPLNEL